MDAISFVLGEKTSNLRVKKLSVRMLSDYFVSVIDLFCMLMYCGLSSTLDQYMIQPSGLHWHV